MADIPAAVREALGDRLGEPSGRASVAFVGTPEITVLRFGPDADGIVTYATLGCSTLPMSGAAADVVDPGGPRAELTLALRGGRDEVLRPLAVLASSPVVDGVVLAPGMSLDLGEPLWPGSGFTSVLIDEPRLPDVDVAAPQPVRLLPLVPLTAAEAAAKKVHGPDWLFERWLAASVDLLDPDRQPASLS